MTPHLLEDELHDYLDDDLDAASRTRADEHLAACDACTKALASLRATVARIAALPALAHVTPPRLELQPNPAVRPRAWTTALRVAAALLLFVAGAAFGTWRERAYHRVPAPPGALSATLEVQRAGSDYVAAVSRAATTTGPSAEVALGPVQAVAHELVKKSPDDPDYQALLVLARHLRARAAQPTVSF
jgi:anti-sigma factor RsiW